jgi:allantoinase
MIDLCREFKCRIHIVHLSSAKALAMLGNARAEGLPITVETCPHYLHFAAEQIADGATLFKCAPPIRGKMNQARLWEGLLTGVIDLVASDHSPCPPEMKRLRHGQLPASLGRRRRTLRQPAGHVDRTARAVCRSPIWRDGWPRLRQSWPDSRTAKGSIAAGLDADLVVFDPEASFTLTADRLHYRHPISPYLGEQLSGVVRRTFLRGREVFANGSFPGDPTGAELRR